MARRDTRILAGVLLGLALLAGLHAGLVAWHTVRLSALPAGAAEATPYRLLRPEFTADAHLWIRQATELAEGAGWRNRTTTADNAPAGREVHWNSGYAWWLAAGGRLVHAVTGLPLPRAVETAALGVNLPLLLGVIAGLAVWTCRREGVTAAVFVAVAAFGSRFLYDGFWPGNADHHGLAGATLLAMALGAFWMRGGEGNGQVAAARWSGWWGGVGLWISAATMIPALAAVGLAGVAAALAGGRGGAAGVAPAVWRAWGRTGALVSVGFYLLEYFPDHLGWRLEVNHPLHALAWWAGAELLAAWAGSRPGGEAASRDWRWTAAWAAPLLLAPLVAVLAGGAEVFAPLDPFLAGLHRMILEFLPLWDRWALEGWRGDYECVLIVPAFQLLGVWMLWRRSGDPPAVVFALVILTVPHLLGLGQARWMGGTPAGLVLIGLLCLRGIREVQLRAKRRAFLFGLPAVLVLPTLVLRTVEAREMWIGRSPAPAGPSLARAVAQAIRVDQPDGDVVVWSGPNTSHDVAFYGRFRTLGTLYWENRAGLAATAAIAGAGTDADAADLLRSHGVTHVVLTPDDAVLLDLVRLRAATMGRRAGDRGFAARLLAGEPAPDWLEPLGTGPAVAGARLWRVNFGPVTAEAAYRRADQAWKDGQPEAALAGFTRSAELGHSGARLRRVEILVLQRRWPEAAAELDLVLTQAPAEARYRLLAQMGTALAEAGERARAGEVLQRALREQVTDLEAPRRLAWLLATAPEARLRQPETALALARQCVRLNPEDALAWRTLAAAQAVNGDFAGAGRSLERALNLRQPGGPAENSWEEQLRAYRRGETMWFER